MISSIGFPSAKDRPLFDLATSLPNVSGTIVGWFRPLILVRVGTRIVQGETVQSEEEFFCRGAVQPFGPRELVLKPEGERVWDWRMLHTTPDVKLRDGELFKIRNVPYRVMSTKGYDEYGMIMYELVENWRGNTNG